MDGPISMQSSQTICTFMRRLTPSFRLAFFHSRPHVSTDRRAVHCRICSCSRHGEQLRGVQTRPKLPTTHTLHSSSRCVTSASSALVRSSNDANGAGTTERPPDSPAMLLYQGAMQADRITFCDRTSIPKSGRAAQDVPVHRGGAPHLRPVSSPVACPILAPFCAVLVPG
jgi:hypothetical protein